MGDRREWAGTVIARIQQRGAETLVRIRGEGINERWLRHRFQEWSQGDRARSFARWLMVDYGAEEIRVPIINVEGEIRCRRRTS